MDEIRKSPIPAKSYDITFVDRYSMCIINAEEYLKEENIEQIARGFYNDTYLLDQNACTAPHLIVWKGNHDTVEKAKEKFWNSLKALLKDLYPEVQPVIAVNKLTTFYSQAFELNNLDRVLPEDNLLWRVELNELPKTPISSFDLISTLLLISPSATSFATSTRR